MSARIQLVILFQYLSSICNSLMLYFVKASSGDIRLVSPLNNGVGRIEVYYRGVWGTICDNDFTDEAAKVACRQMGMYQEGFQPKQIQGFGFGTGLIWLIEVNCDGTESSLENCSHRHWGTHDCGHSEDVGVICDERSVTMKLTPNYKSGLLQIYHNNSWGTVCDHGFGKVEATVVCRALGFESGDVTHKVSSIRMWLDDVDCSVNNTDLKDCRHREWGQHDCLSNEAVGVDCYSFPEASSGDIRLVSPLNNGVGRIEVYYRGVWGTVCDDVFTDQAAKVACRQLGMYQEGFQPKMIQGFGFGTGLILLDDVNCKGTESSLENCSHRKWGAHNCGHSEDVGVICDERSVTMKLTPRYKSGLLQIYHNNSWGTVCDHGFGKVEATVVCRALGFESGDVTHKVSSIRMWLDDVDCSMNNTDLKDCRHREWGQHNCLNNETVGVDCYSFAEVSSAARLVSFNNTPGEGRVELYYGGQWGTVCTRGLGSEVVTVMCRMLGYNGGGTQSTRYPKTGSGPVLLEDVHCKGTETNITYCTHSKWNSSTCSHSDDLVVRCFSARLVFGGSNTHGRLEIYNRNQWGTVCDAGFTNMSAKVACRMAGLPDMHAYFTPGGSFDRGSGPIWLSNVRCSGSETNIGSCSHSSWGRTSCVHSQDVGVVCSYPPEIHLDPNTERINISIGNNLAVECVVDDANPAVSTFTWLHNEKSTTGQVFRIQNITKADMGKLSCLADSGLGLPPGRAETYINVLYVMNVDMGENLTINCVVEDANPNITSVKWMHNDHNRSGSTFHIQNVTQSDEGRLTCTAHNGVGISPGRADTFIRVVEKPLDPSQATVKASEDDSSKWTMIHTIAVVTGVVAVLIIVLLVIMLLYLCRKHGSVSVQKEWKSEGIEMVAASNSCHDQEDCEDSDYEKPVTALHGAPPATSQIQKRVPKTWERKPKMVAASNPVYDKDDDEAFYDVPVNEITHQAPKHPNKGIEMVAASNSCNDQEDSEDSDYEKPVTPPATSQIQKRVHTTCERNPKMVAGNNPVYDKEDDEAVYDVIDNDITHQAPKSPNKVRGGLRRKPSKTNARTNQTLDEDDAEEFYENVGTIEKAKSLASRVQKSEDVYENF